MSKKEEEVEEYTDSDSEEALNQANNDDEDENGDNDWLGSGSEDEENDLVKREKTLAKYQNEFAAEVDDSHLELIDREQLEAPAVDYDQVRERASQIIMTLDNFKTAADKDIPRSQYMEKLYDDLCILYGYNRFLLEKIVSLVKVSEILDFLDANEHHRPVTIRKNTIRTSHNNLEHALNERGVRLAPVGKWTKNLGLMVIETQVPVGATPEYLTGYYMLQSPSSFLPVISLNPKPGSRVLDMCAAPGGKTTHLAQIMKNQGMIVANDYHKARTNALVANIHRLGVTNAIVVNYDGRAFPEVMGGFDYVLCDAPCSGTGVISRDPSVKTTKTEQDLQFLTKQQKELILHAFDSVKPSKGGKLCYCTCSVLVEENEEVVDYLLRKRDRAKVLPPPIDKDFDEQLTPGITRYCGKHFSDQIKNARRVYPHKLNMDGFFFALIDVLPLQKDQNNEDEEESEKEVPNQNAGKNESKKRKKKRAFTKRMSGK